jgi:hypothetical protein
MDKQIGTEFGCIITGTTQAREKGQHVLLLKYCLSSNTMVSAIFLPACGTPSYKVMEVSCLLESIVKMSKHCYCIHLKATSDRLLARVLR